MKKINIIIIVIALLSFTQWSCKKMTNNVNPTSGSLSCTIDGKSWSAKDPGAIRLLGSITVSGDASDKSSLSISIDETAIKAGAKIDVTSDAINGFETGYFPANGGGYLPTSGTIEITNFSKSHIEGKFNFTTTNPVNSKSVTITNGTFSTDIVL